MSRWGQNLAFALAKRMSALADTRLQKSDCTIARTAPVRFAFPLLPLNTG
jgi:hypothetical protein